MIQYDDQPLPWVLWAMAVFLCEKLMVFTTYVPSLIPVGRVPRGNPSPDPSFNQDAKLTFRSKGARCLEWSAGRGIRWNVAVVISLEL